jgi:hypothetical protein
MNPANHGWCAWLLAWLVLGADFNIAAQSTNNLGNTDTRVERAPRRFDESAFRIVAERNIFNANRSGGQVRLPSRRPSSVEFFTLVGTMDYEKGTFAFFEGSNSQLTKVLKPDSVIAGYKLVTISPNNVKLESDGKEIELPVGSQMRREDEGLWQMAEARGGFSAASAGNGDASSRSSRSDRNDSSSRTRRDDSSSRRSDNSESNNRATTTATPSANEDEVLKRLMERREKESQ